MSKPAEVHVLVQSRLAAGREPALQEKVWARRCAHWQIDLASSPADIITLFLRQLSNPFEDKEKPGCQNGTCRVLIEFRMRRYSKRTNGAISTFNSKQTLCRHQSDGPCKNNLACKLPEEVVCADSGRKSTPSSTLPHPFAPPPVVILGCKGCTSATEVNREAR